MSTPDWIILLLTLAAMVVYGLYKGRGQQGAQSYLLADRQMPWYVVLLGIMATQASAVTFLSAPGQAYTDGMRFVQYYFGLPLAMIVICVTFIPIFRRLGVYTAYEYLEQRFDRKTRLLTSILFLLSRGLSTGISIYAPSIILSSMLGWDIYLTNVLMGGLLIVYTYSGGAKAVAHTQKLQFLIILASMAVAGYMVVQKMPHGLKLQDALYIAGKAGKLNVITTDFHWKDKYNIWSGLIGGFFLSLSYFGTDQSQVGRYLTGKDTRESTLGLLLNGMVKIPMQFLILLIGALVFSFYSFSPAPVHFNTRAFQEFKQKAPEQAEALETRFAALHQQTEKQSETIAAYHKQGSDAGIEASVAAFKESQSQIKLMRDSVSSMLFANKYSPDKNDTNYIFLHFVKNSLPIGLIGLLFAVIILASWGSISAALNSLAASSLMDLHLLDVENVTERQQLRYGRIHTLGWGIFCIVVAMFAARLGSLIEAVNILGSLFYGTILGIFLVAFYIKRVGGTTVFYSAIFTEAIVCFVYYLDIISFLWLNVLGAVLMVFFCGVVTLASGKNTSAS